MATGGNMTPNSDPMTPQYEPRTLLAIANVGRAANKHTAAHVLSRSALPGVCVHAVRGKPARAMLAAIRDPMMPSPRKPMRSRFC